MGTTGSDSAGLTLRQDREAEPRFGPPGGAARGGFQGGMGGGPYGGGGFNPGMAGGAGGRQIYVSNVCHNSSCSPWCHDSEPLVY
jgi:hypothetical protein